MSFLKADVDSAHVKFPPPLIALLSILFGTLLNWFWPAPKYRTIEDNIPYRHDRNLWSF